MNPGIHCRHLSIAFPGPSGQGGRILNGVDAHFPPGRVSIVTGPVGAGKSTLLHIMAGLRRPTAGEVSADGRAVSRWSRPHLDRWRRGVGIVFQQDHLLPDRTVLENIMLPLIPLGKSLAECRRRAREAAGRAGLLHQAHRTVNALSGGERQKTAIARALVNRPRFLFADEPTSHQDEENAGRVMGLLVRAAEGGAVVVVAAHESALAAAPGGALRFRLAAGVLRPLTA